MQSLIRELGEEDISALESIDNQYAKIVAEELKCINELEDTKFYGIFKDRNTLVGFCSVSPATYIPSGVYWTENSKLISEFYILEEYRNEGYGSELLSKVIEPFSNSNDPVFFEADNSTIARFCTKLGFIDVNNDFLVILPNNEDENNLCT